MRNRGAGLLLTGVLALSPWAAGQGVGTPFPEAQLEDLAQTAARSFDDYQGRLVLIEFFAYW